MLFSSTIFIFIYLPLVLFGNFLLRKYRKAQNAFLCFASLFFYAWGEPKFVLIMIASIIANWAFGIFVDKNRENGIKSRLYLAIDVCINLAILFVFKYLGFTLRNIRYIFGQDSISFPEIALPIGISFFTFQALSYVIDVYRGNAGVQKNIINVALYISFFPQLIAGPIVRYTTVEEQIRTRIESKEDFSDGVVRFIIGLGKKMLIANNMAVVSDFAFSTSGDNPMMLAWLGAIAYTFQIYFDFSGYSDMAIGLGKMFGFHFLENFNYPYISTSITEFWRRWHISMGTWFRDYVYIPLGGNRTKTKGRHIFNLFIVWLCTGIWHGANWTFIVWGLMYFILLTIEKYLPINFGKDGKLKTFRFIYTMLFVICGWVIFRANSLADAGAYLKNMFNTSNGIINDGFIEYGRQYLTYFAAAIICSLPVVPMFKERAKNNKIASAAAAGFLVIVALFSISSMVKSSYNPFIYFNF